MEASRTSFEYLGWHPDVPVPILEDLRCDICHKYLSVFPVHMSPSLGTICGRCPIMEEDLRDAIMRNKTYEKVAELSRFPCSNDEFGCVEKLTPSAISAHEKICKFRQVKCPCIQAECEWKGPCTSLADHFEDKHSNFLMKQPTFLVEYITKKVNMLVLEEGIFLFHREYDVYSKKFRYSLEYLCLDEKPADFSYHLTFRCRDLKYPETPAIKLVENATEIDVDFVNHTLRCVPLQFGTIEIIRNNVTDQNEEESVYVQEKEVSKQMLKILECPVCLEYMTEPIIQCLGGHSICSICRNKITDECPVCRQQIKETRNFVAESMLSHILYPCKYAASGCEFTIEGSEITDHENYCEFRTVPCPFSVCESCDYECQLNSMMNHILDRHKYNILERGESGDILNVSYQNKIVRAYDCFVLKYADKIFIVHVKALNYSFKWSLQFLGSLDESVNCFKLEIYILDNTKNGRRIYLREACSKFTGAEQAFNNDSDYLSINSRLVKRMMMMDTFTYRMRMIKDVV